MNTWPIMRLGEVARVRGGKRLPKGMSLGTEPTPHPYIRLVDMRDGGIGIDMGNIQFIDEATHKLISRYTIGVDDVFVSIAGTVGLVGQVPAALEGANLTENAAKITVTATDRLAPAFLSAFLQLPTTREAMRALAGGAAQPKLALYKIESLLLPVPPLRVQRKIDAILSAYDDLIENNKRRIKLLDEMAQRIYGEWFVDLRYPGHEGVPLVDSELGPMPEGWSVKRMDEVTDVIDCLHSLKPRAATGGTGILLQLFNIGSGGILDLSHIFKISPADYLQWTSRIELRGGDCVITNVGRVAAVAQVPPSLKAAPGRNMTAIRPRAIPPTYLLQYLLSEHMDHEVHKKKDAGSIMDSLNVKGIVKLAVPVPDDALAMRFEQLARPLRNDMELLIARQQNLHMTRDLLLPRLISGGLDVTDLDITVPEAAA